MSEEFSVLRTWPATRPLHVAMAQTIAVAFERGQPFRPCVLRIWQRMPATQREDAARLALDMLVARVGQS